MKKGNIQLQLATLRKEYLQNILFPEVIIVETQRTKRVNDYSATYNKLDDSVKTFTGLGYSHLDQPSPVLNN